MKSMNNKKIIGIYWDKTWYSCTKTFSCEGLIIIYPHWHYIITVFFFPILTFFGGKTKINFIHQTERFFCWEISVSPPLGMPQSEATRLSYDFVRQKKKHHGLQVNKHVGGPPKIVVFTPQIIHFHRVFHEINHPFWGTIIFGNMLNFGGV